MVRLGNIYSVHSKTLTIQAAAHGATAGFFWLENPVASSKRAAIKRIQFRSALSEPGTPATFESSPRITVERMSFSNTSTGSTLSPAKHNTLFDTPSVIAATASTGSGTLVAGPAIMGFLIPPLVTAVGAVSADEKDWLSPDDTRDIILLAGEGIVVRQADAGSPSDSRKFIADIEWEEF